MLIGESERIENAGDEKRGQTGGLFIQMAVLPWCLCRAASAPTDAFPFGMLGEHYILKSAHTAP